MDLGERCKALNTEDINFCSLSKMPVLPPSWSTSRTTRKPQLPRGALVLAHSPKARCNTKFHHNLTSPPQVTMPLKVFEIVDQNNDENNRCTKVLMTST